MLGSSTSDLCSEGNTEGTGSPAASRSIDQKRKSSKAAGASEEDAMSITSTTEKVVPTTGRQEQHGTEL